MENTSSVLEVNINGSGQIRKLSIKKADINTCCFEHNGRKDMSALMIASYCGDHKSVELLLENGAQVDLKDNDGWSALMYASLNGHSEVVKLLLENSAQVDLKDNRGCSVLMLASMMGHSEVVKRLLENGAQVDSVDEEGALMCAIIMWVYKVLLDNGAQVDWTNDINSALMLVGSEDTSKLSNCCWRMVLRWT